MTVGTVFAATPTPPPPPPLEAALGLAPRIRARAAWIDAERRLPDDLVQDLAGAGLFKMAVPREEGGGGADLLTVLRTIEAVSAADGSTGWCLAMGVNTFRHSAQFAAPVRRELFASDPVGVSAGSSTPRGVALAVPGGYRVTGRWPFASGCMHASSLHGACRVFQGDAPRLLPNGEGEVRIAYFYPKAVAEIEDTWSVSGMRGTGSHDVVVDGLFVPEERTFSAAERRARVTGPVNSIPGFDLAGCGFACVGLGVARAAIDALVELAAAKTPRYATTLLRERPQVQAQVGEAEALLRAGRAFLFEVAGGMQQDAAAGRQIAEPQRAQLRLAMTHAAQGAARATHMMSVAAGASSIFTASPLERYTRDAEVVTRHIQLQALNYEAVGRTLLGLESTSPLF